MTAIDPVKDLQHRFSLVAFYLGKREAQLWAEFHERRDQQMLADARSFISGFEREIFGEAFG